MDQANHLILLADDDADDRLLMELSFKTLEWSHKVKMVGSGEEALDYLDALPPHFFPALIILDYHMPRLNGAATLKQIKSRHLYKDIPVVVYSTNMSVMLK